MQVKTKFHCKSFLVGFETFDSCYYLIAIVCEKFN